MISKHTDNTKVSARSRRRNAAICKGPKRSGDPCVYKSCEGSDFCKLHENYELILPDEADQYTMCKCDEHVSFSLFPPNKVPKYMFWNETKLVYNLQCADCCLKKVEQFEEFKSRRSKLEVKEGHKLCNFRSHTNVSQYPKNEVPIELFRIEPNDPRSSLYSSCLSCREYMITESLEYRNTKITIRKEKNSIFCGHCEKECELSDMSIRLDGTYGRTCIKCKEKERNYELKRKNLHKTIKYEFSLKLESNCNRCYSIFLSQGNNPVLEIPTFLKEGIRQLIYDNVEWSSKEFLEIFKDDIELDILQFDHLPEEEQRKRGLLAESDIFVPKKKMICKLTSETSVRLELLKCQLLCGKCHVTETIAREKGMPYTDKSKLQRQKLEYVAPLKHAGCSMCGYKNIDLIRFFHFDHLDPSLKTMMISTMCMNNKYTLDDLKTEVKKCRILCQHCHNIVTKEQRRLKLI